jgi:hypothetical protein
LKVFSVAQTILSVQVCPEIIADPADTRATAKPLSSFQAKLAKSIRCH